MTTGMNLWDANVWSFVITMTLLFGSMLLANILLRVGRISASDRQHRHQKLL